MAGMVMLFGSVAAVRFVSGTGLRVWETGQFGRERERLGDTSVVMRVKTLSIAGMVAYSAVTKHPTCAMITISAT